MIITDNEGIKVTAASYVYSFTEALVNPNQIFGAKTDTKFFLESPSNILLKSFPVDGNKKAPNKEERLRLFHISVKDHTAKGGNFSIARASLALLAQSLFNPLPLRITVLSCQPCKEEGLNPAISVSLCFDNNIGNHIEPILESPLHALSNAFRFIICKFRPDLQYVSVRNPSQTSFAGEGDKPVYVHFRDERAGLEWKTLGFRKNVFDAYVDAITDGYRFRLDPRFRAYVRKQDPALEMFIPEPKEPEATRKEVVRQDRQPPLAACTSVS